MPKKRKDRSQKKHGQQQQSFQDYMLGQTMKRFQSYIDQQVQATGQMIAQQQKETMNMFFTRLVILEELLIEKHDDVTKERLASLVAEHQDKAEGFEEVEEVESGDRVRLELKYKKKDDEKAEWSNTSRMLVENAGSNATLGEDLEQPLLGMKAGESKEVEFGNEKNIQVAVLTINRVSRKPKPEPKPKSVEPEKKEEEPKDDAADGE